MSKCAHLLTCFFIVAFASSPLHAQTTCPPIGWGPILGPGSQTFDTPVRIDQADGTHILLITFGELTGDFAKVFLALKYDGDCLQEAVSHGSYGSYALRAENGKPRRHHLDWYAPDQHATLGFSDGPMSLEDFKTKALERLK